MSRASRTQGLGPTASEALKVIESRPKLKKEYELTIGIFNRVSTTAITSHIELGRLGLRLRDDPGRTYGDHAVDLMGAALGMHRATFRRAMQVVEYFPEEELDMIQVRKSVAGLIITPGHIRVILPVPSQSARTKLLEMFYTKNSSVVKLAEKAATFLGHRASGEPRMRSITGAASQLKKMAATFKTRLEGNGLEVFFDRIDNYADGKLTAEPDDLALVTSVRENLESVRDGLELAIEKVQKAESVIENQIHAGAAA